MENIIKLPRLALNGGILLYLLCLWRGCPSLDDKAYFLAMVVLGLFAVVAHRQAANARFAELCRLVLLLASGLLLVGVWNMPLPLIDKSVIVAAWFACMYGAATWPQPALASSN